MIKCTNNIVIISLKIGSLSNQGVGNGLKYNSVIFIIFNTSYRIIISSTAGDVPIIPIKSVSNHFLTIITQFIDIEVGIRVL